MSPSSSSNDALSPEDGAILRNFFAFKVRFAASFSLIVFSKVCVELTVAELHSPCSSSHSGDRQRAPLDQHRRRRLLDSPRGNAVCLTLNSLLKIA